MLKERGTVSDRISIREKEKGKKRKEKKHNTMTKMPETTNKQTMSA
jgi:hypothetical protein